MTKADSLTKVADYEKNPDEWKYPEEQVGVSGIRSIPSLLYPWGWVSRRWMGRILEAFPSGKDCK